MNPGLDARLSARPSQPTIFPILEERENSIDDREGSIEDAIPNVSYDDVPTQSIIYDQYRPSYRPSTQSSLRPSFIGLNRMSIPDEGVINTLTSFSTNSNTINARNYYNELQERFQKPNVPPPHEEWM